MVPRENGENQYGYCKTCRDNSGNPSPACSYRVHSPGSIQDQVRRSRYLQNGSQTRSQLNFLISYSALWASLQMSFDAQLFAGRQFLVMICGKMSGNVFSKHPNLQRVRCEDAPTFVPESGVRD